MVGQNLRSRSNRRRKKRKNSRNLTIVLALAFLFFTILLAAIVLNKNDDSEVEQEAPTGDQEVNETEKDTSDNESDSIEYKKEDDPNDDSDEISDEENKDEEEKVEEEEEDEGESSVSIRELDPEEIDGSNIIKAYEGDWEPVGTNQAGEHTTNYQNGSKDRMEIKRAVSDVTDVPEDDMVEWRVENGGDQQVISTVSDSNEEEYFRIYLTWIDNEGWQVDKLEHLKENDKK